MKNRWVPHDVAWKFQRENTATAAEYSVALFKWFNVQFAAATLLLESIRGGKKEENPPPSSSGWSSPWIKQSARDLNPDRCTLLPEQLLESVYTFHLFWKGRTSARASYRRWNNWVVYVFWFVCEIKWYVLTSCFQFACSNY